MPDDTPNHPGSFLAWLLARLADGEELTDGGELGKDLAGEAAALRPAWHDIELSGPPEGEDDLPQIAALREALTAGKMVRSHDGMLTLSSKGKLMLTEALRSSDPVAADRKLATQLLEMVFATWDEQNFDDFIAIKTIEIGVGTVELDARQMAEVLFDLANEQGWFINDESLSKRDVLRGIWQAMFLAEGLNVATWRGGRGVGEAYVPDPVCFSPEGCATLIDAGVTNGIRVWPTTRPGAPRIS